MNSSFCVLPFYRTVVRTNGGLSPCCLINNYDNIKNTDINIFWKSEKLNQLRKNMLEGKHCEDCNICYSEEQKFGKSMRTESLRDHGITLDTDLVSFVNNDKYLDRPIPNHLEFHVGNICNLKCLTCRPEDSSAFLSENKILKISDHQQEKYQVHGSTVEKTISTISTHGIEVLDLRGGESMLVPSIRDLILSLPADHNIKCLRLQSNCTILDDFWMEAFKKFETVEIMLSIDGFGVANDYIRYPSNWDQIEKNVDYFLSLSNAKIYVNCTISNLNFLLLKPLIDWCQEKNIYFHYSICSHPEIFRYTNLPQDLYQHGVNQLQGWSQIKSLSSHTSDTTQWSDFCTMIDKRDKHRHNSIFEILPEFKPYWKTTCDT